MSSTNKTTYYELSQFLGSDKPAWLVDYNGDMSKIDAGIKEAKDAADAAQSTANTADSKADTNATAISTLDGQINGVSGIASDLSALQGSVNTINSLIGNGEPTTTDKTLIGAINELNGEMPTLKEGYILGEYKSFTANADGTKTYRQLGEDLKTQVTSYLATHDAFLPIAIVIAGVTGVPNNGPYITADNIATREIDGSSVMVESASDTFYKLRVSFSNSSRTIYHESVFDGTTRTYTDNSTQVAAHNLAILGYELVSNS